MKKIIVKNHYLLLGILILTSLTLPLIHTNAFRYVFIEPKFALYDIISSFITLYYFYYKKEFQLPLLSILSFILLLLMFISIFQSANIIYSFEVIFRFFNLIIFIALLYDFLKAKIITMEDIGKLFIFSTFLFLIYYYYGTYITHIFNSNTSFSSIGHVNYTAHVLNIWIPLLVLNFFIQTNKFFKYSSLIIVICLIDILLVSGARGSILGLIFTEFSIFIFLFIKHKKLVFYPIITFILIVSFLSHKYIMPSSITKITTKIERSSTTIHQVANKGSYLSYNNLNHLSSSRLNVYNNTFDMILDNPWGVGAGNYEYLHPLYAKLGTPYTTVYINEKQVWTNPHNIILKFFSEIGWIGGSFFILLLLLLLKMSFTLLSYGNKEDYLIVTALGATLFHAMLSAVFLTPVQLFFSTFLFALLLYRYHLLNPYKTIFTLNQLCCKSFLIFIFLFFSLFHLSKYYNAQFTKQRNFNYLEKAIQLNPYNDQAIIKQAQFAAYAQQDYALAIHYLERYLELYPYNINGHMKKANFEYKIKRYNAALKTIEHLLSFDKKNKKMLDLKKRILKKK